MKIQKVVLRDRELVETDDGFEVKYTNEKTYPAQITHAALKKGNELGIIDGSLVEDVLRIGSTSDENAPLSDNRMLAVVYLGYLGANPKEPYSFDEFVEKFHYSTYEMFELYSELTADIVTKEKNNFAVGFNKSTEKAEKK